MGNTELDLRKPVEIPGDEDAETLAAIDRGIEDANAARVTPAEDVRKMLPQWISESSTQTRR